MRLLLIQRDEEYAQRLKDGLQQRSYLVDLVTSGDEGFEQAAQESYDVIVLAIQLLDTDGIALCRQLRRRGVATPLIILSVLEDTEKKIEALDAGADDYLTRPVELEELCAHIRAMVRRCQDEEGAMLRFEDLEMDLANRNVSRNGTSIVLTPREFALLEYLLRNRNRVVSRLAIGDRVWGLDFRDENSNIVDVYISRLRRKLDRDHTPLIHTAHGTGYILASTPPSN